MLMYLYLSQVPNDKRTLVATTFLRGNAQQWMKPHLTKYLATRRDPEGMFTDYTVFQRKFKELFGISNEVARATRDIQNVRQERSAAEYAAKFREHSNLLGWDNESLMVMYRRGLKENVKDELARYEVTRDEGKFLILTDLINKSIELDDVLYDRTMEKKYDGKGGKMYDSLRERSGTHYQTNRQRDPNAMDWQRTLGSTEKRRNPRNNKNSKKEFNCYACGKIGHMARDCRSKNKVPRQQFNTMQRQDARGGYNRAGETRQFNAITRAPAIMEQRNARAGIERLWKQVTSLEEIFVDLYVYLEESYYDTTNDWQRGQREKLCDALQELEDVCDDKRKKIDELKGDTRTLATTTRYQGETGQSQQQSDVLVLAGLQHLIVLLEQEMQKIVDEGTTDTARLDFYSILEEQLSFARTRIAQMTEPVEVRTLGMTLRKTDNDDEHVLLDWTKCYRKNCQFHDQYEEEQWPGQRTNEDQKPLAQQPEGPETQTLRTDGYRVTPVDHLYDEDEDEEDPHETQVYYLESSREMRELVTEIMRKDQIMFPPNDEAFVVSEDCINSLYSFLRRRYWPYPRVAREKEYAATFVQEVPPIGSRFQEDGSYITPKGLHVTKEMRAAVQGIKEMYGLTQQVQTLENFTTTQARAEAQHHYQDMERFQIQEKRENELRGIVTTNHEDQGDFSAHSDSGKESALRK